MAYDETRGRVVLFGGQDADDISQSDTWEWDGENWTALHPDLSPPARRFHAMVFDSARERVVLFGGYDPDGGSLADTWEWDGEDWIERSSPVSPSARDHHGMSYDVASRRVILFGGSTNNSQSNLLSDTWEWDGTEWRERYPAVSPNARNMHSMAFDVARGRIILFGGLAGSKSDLTAVLGDTWEWNGSTWIKLAPDSSPPPRWGHVTTYDQGRGRIMLFGGVFGRASGRIDHDDTWEWDGFNWRQLRPTMSPPGRGSHAITYDSARGRMVLFGGGNFIPLWTILADTWETGTPSSPIYLPLAIQNSRKGDFAKPVSMINLCPRLVAGAASMRKPSVIELSNAHGDIRYFGVEEDYVEVDQALVRAFRSSSETEWPEESAAQLRFLESYASGLAWACALSSAPGTLGPARVELVGETTALVRPGTGPVVLPDEARAVAVDLREIPNVPGLAVALEAAVAPALNSAVPRAPRPVRHHRGHSTSSSSSGQYGNNYVDYLDTDPITSTGTTSLPLLLLTDSKMAPETADIAGTLRLANRAVIIGDSVVSSVAESRWSSVGENGLAWRWTDLRHLGPPEPAIKFRDLEVDQDDCSDYSTASVKENFTTENSTVRVTVRLTSTVGIDPEAQLELLLLFDENKDGKFELWDEVLIEPGDGLVGVVNEVLPPGEFQVWVHGCAIPDPPATADLTVEINSGFRWPDVIPADIQALDPLGRLEDGIALWPELEGLDLPPAARREVRKADGYSGGQPVSTGAAEQQAALVSLHGTLRRFFPYFDVVGDGIDDRLIETLAAEHPGDDLPRSFIQNSLRRMSEVISDSHVLVLDHGSGTFYFDLPATLESVAGEPVVRDSSYDGINPGDTILSIGGRPAADAYAEEFMRTSASTEGSRFRRASSHVKRLDGATALELLDPDGLTRSVTVTSGAEFAPRYPREAGWLDDLDAANIFYINLDSATLPNTADFRAALTEADSASALVLDVRGYPGYVNSAEVIRRLITATVQAPVLRWKIYNGPDEITQVESQGSYTPLEDPHFPGPIALLVGPGTISQAEHLASTLVGADRVTIIGQRSAGTNGVVTRVGLPGSFSVTFTGMEVLYPDRSVFHGVGIVPDIEAVPSAADFRDGVDRELVTAIEFLKRP